VPKLKKACDGNELKLKYTTEQNRNSRREKPQKVK
jgi:hypothetical protein